MPSTNNPFGNFTPGQAPGNNQVNLGAMYGNLANVLNAGSLGTNAINNNPMTSTLQDMGQSQLGYQNAIANARMADIGQQSQEQALQEQEQAWQNQQQQPGLLDYLGLGLSGANAIEGASKSSSIQNLLKSIGGSNLSLDQLSKLNNLPEPPK